MHDGVSVVIPTHNRSALVARAVTSALAAMSAGDELIVVDDGSTDDTADVLRQFGNAIRYVRIENAGPSAARNVGISLTTCPLVAFLDSDDEWLPDKLRLQRRVMEAFPQAVYCFGNGFCRDLDGVDTPDMMSSWKTAEGVGCVDPERTLTEALGPGVPYTTVGKLSDGRADFAVHVGDIYFSLMEVLYVSAITIMVRKDLAGDAFYFPEDLHIAEDWDCFARLARIGPVAYLDCELAINVAHEGPRLTGSGNLQQATGRITVLRRVWGQDEEFLTSHAARYTTILNRQLLRRAKLLVMQGQLQQAREDLKAIGGHWPYRVLTRLPGPVVAGFIGARRRLLDRLAPRHA